MKKENALRLFALLFGFVFFCACTDEDAPRYAGFSGMSVTVQGSDMEGYKLYTDFDAILIPTNIDALPALKKVSRAQISFDMLNGNTDINAIRPGETYEILLNTDALNTEIPTFTNNIDIQSQEYLTAGEDSIRLKNEPIRSFNKSEGQFYVKNGYLNVTPTFDCSPDKMVYFSLYYDSSQDLNMSDRELTLHLYFNNSTDTPYGTVSSLLSFRMSEEIYGMFRYEGLNDEDMLTIRLKAHTENGQEDELQYSAELGELMLP